MNQKIYNALRRIDGYANIHAGDGFNFLVWLDWGHPPIDLSNDADDALVNLGFKEVTDKALFESSNRKSGFKQIAIGLITIEDINGTPIADRIACL